MTRNDETRRTERVCHCAELCITCDCNPTESPRINQAIRLPSGTRYHLRRYRDDLRPHAEEGDDQAKVMLALCNNLLDSADVLEGVTG
jgi:hypothetical protein